ncbi:MAG: glycosyltransferase [Candidatus Peribacteraceae bacterium]|jgi:hypothetical protein|nr:glycosyltransferase [Candidatus Peribacteraceae bacterium]
MDDVFGKLWQYLVHPLLESANSLHILEIGSETGNTTKKLAEYCLRKNGTLHAIDPSPHYDTTKWEERYGKMFTFHQKTSLEALPDISGYDTVLIDGDHNWYTIFNELQLIEKHCKTFPLVLLNDTGWPYARRDLYYNPDTIPSEFRHTHEKKGVIPQQSTLLKHGGLNAMLEHATIEGGARNGVLTGVEDFLKQSKSNFTFINIPGFHGLGILVSDAALEGNTKLKCFLDSLAEHSVLLGHAHVLEQERIAEKLRKSEEQLVEKALLKQANQTIITNKCILETEQKKWAGERAMLRATWGEERATWGEERARWADEQQSTVESLQRIMQSKSWRWTELLRRTEALLHKKLKNRVSEPTKLEAVTPHPDFAVSVIIPCHNYGTFLGKAIESVLAQTYKPAKIIVMDDASTDDTKEVTMRYSDRGVVYVRCENRSLSLTRNAGAKCTNTPFLMYLDADDYLPPHYIEKCIAPMHDPKVALVYGDMQNFGDDNRLLNIPQFDHDRLERQNYISSHALIRRQVLDLVGGYRNLPGFALEDWDFYRRALQFNWTARKADTYVYYRVHSDSMLLCVKDKRTYCNDAALLHQPITIFTPFAGRLPLLDRYIQSIKDLEFDPKLIHLHCFDTSNNPEFATALKEALANLDIGRITYSDAPLPKFWKQTPEKLIRNRVSDKDNAQYFYEMAVVYAYNTLLRNCETEYVLVIEDDVVISSPTIRSMLETVDENTVGVVAHYPCHLQGYSMVWKKNPSGGVTHFPKQKSGIEKVDGSGFGCSLFRTRVLKKMPIFTRVQSQPKEWYDHIAFKRLAQHGKILCNWDIGIEHIKTKRYKKEPQSASAQVPIAITEEDVNNMDNPYYLNRWKYYEKAIEMCQQFNPQRILEIGPYKLPLFHGSDTLDSLTNVKPTFLHDATDTPWPIEDKSYDLLIGLQIWEQFDTEQQKCFLEAMRVARYAVLSFPLEWNTPNDPTHHNITEAQIMEWCLNTSPLQKVAIGSRLIVAFDLENAPVLTSAM